MRGARAGRHGQGPALPVQIEQEVGPLLRVGDAAEGHAGAGSGFVAELPRQFVERLIRLGAAVAEENFSTRLPRRAGKKDETIGELDLR